MSALDPAAQVKADVTADSHNLLATAKGDAKAQVDAAADAAGKLAAMAVGDLSHILSDAEKAEVPFIQAKLQVAAPGVAAYAAPFLQMIQSATQAPIDQMVNSTLATALLKVQADIKALAAHLDASLG